VNSDSETKKTNEPAGIRRWAILPRLRVVVVAATAALLIGSGVWIYVRYFVDPPDVRYVVPRGGHVMYIPSPQDVVDRMLELADVTKDDVIYDLGCGDGRILVTAAKRYGCRCRGYDIDPIRVRESRRNARENGVEDLVEIDREDIFTLDLREADVVFLYLLPKLNVRLIPQLQQLRPGSRIVSHSFDMHGVRPDKVLRMDSSEDGFEHVLYLWTTPLHFEEPE
jgi:SAM-dependent methyltransferase